MQSNYGYKHWHYSSKHQAVAADLVKLLADKYVLCLKTKNAHWHREGAELYVKHKFFETKPIATTGN